MMDIAATGAINPELLDTGIYGLMLNYNVNANRMWNKKTLQAITFTVV